MLHPKFSVKPLIGIVVLVVIIIASLAAVDWRNAVTATVASRDAMIRILGSPKPNPSLGDEPQTFDRLIGSWDAEFSFPQPDGTESLKQVPLTLKDVLRSGPAVQDLWIGAPTGEQKERTIGTTFRFFDTKLKQWRIVFINPQYNYVVQTQGGREGDRIVLRGSDSDGLPIRWTFRELTPESFRWTGEKSHDGGKTWVLEEDHHMKRRAG